MHDGALRSRKPGGHEDRHVEIRAFEIGDPLFENLVRCIVLQCQQFVERHGGDLNDYFVGMSHDVLGRLRSVHHLPDGAVFMIRDGLDRFTARAVIQELLRRGAAGDDRIDERSPVDLYLYRMLPDITCEEMEYPDTPD